MANRIIAPPNHIEQILLQAVQANNTTTQVSAVMPPQVIASCQMGIDCDNAVNDKIITVHHWRSGPFSIDTRGGDVIFSWFAWFPMSVRVSTEPYSLLRPSVKLFCAQKRLGGRVGTEVKFRPVYSVEQRQHIPWMVTFWEFAINIYTLMVMTVTKP